MQKQVLEFAQTVARALSELQIPNANQLTYELLSNRRETEDGCTLFEASVEDLQVAVRRGPADFFFEEQVSYQRQQIIHVMSGLVTVTRAGEESQLTPATCIKADTGVSLSGKALTDFCVLEVNREDAPDSFDSASFSPTR